MRTLTLDAATAVCGAGLVEDGSLLGERETSDLAIMPELVEQLFAAHGRQVDRVVVTVGPGSFTGLRASIALAHGIGLASGAAVSGVTVGAALADGDPAFWTAIDSKRGRVFLERDGSVVAVALDAFPEPTAPIRLGGDAAAAIAARLAPHGAAVTIAASRPGPLAIARAAPARPALPLYVEPPAARPGPPGRPAPA